MSLKIDNPCHENWENMSITLKGRHCNACEKQVVDFTSFSRSEIILYLLEHSNESTCGRLRRDQFEFHQDDLPLLIQALEKPKFKSNAFLILAIVCAGLVSCSTPKDESQIEVKNSIKPRVETSIIQNIDTTKTQNSSSKFLKKNKRNIPPEVIKGEVSILPDPEPTIMGGIEPPMPPPSVEPAQKDSILDFAEVMPEFVGGMEALKTYLTKNLKYPTTCLELGIEGKVFVRFVVHSDGTISTCEIVKGVHPELDKSALHLIRNMPNWNPGINSAKKVAVRFILPVYFKLD